MSESLYLSCDTLLIAYASRNSVLSAQPYSLDCAHNFTVSNLLGDAFNGVCKADVELLTDRDHLDIFEKQ